VTEYKKSHALKQRMEEFSRVLKKRVVYKQKTIRANDDDDDDDDDLLYPAFKS